MIQLSEITNSISPSLTRRLFNLAQKYDNVIDFTLGDPDIHPHDKIKEAGCKAILEGRTRYSPNAGLLELREIISSRYKLQYNIEYNPTNEIMVTVGGMEGLYLTLLAILNRGDEVIIPAPYWINYVQMVCMCSGEPIITAPVSTNDLSISIENIRKAITPKTKAIILNTPSNPSGRIISDDSIQQIAQIAIENDLIVITDEVLQNTSFMIMLISKVLLHATTMKERTVVIIVYQKILYDRMAFGLCSCTFRINISHDNVSREHSCLCSIAVSVCSNRSTKKFGEIFGWYD